MRIPADFDRYKSDGRVSDIDLNDPSINQIPSSFLWTYRDPPRL